MATLPDILYFYLSKELRIRVYFSKPEGVHEHIVWETLQ